VGVRGALLALRFLLELCALAALAYWGATVDASTVVRVILAVVTPLLAAVVWGTWVAPRAPRLLDDPIRLIPEFAVFGGAVLALFGADRPVLATILAVLAVGDRIGLALLPA